MGTTPREPLMDRCTPACSRKRARCSSWVNAVPVSNSRASRSVMMLRPVVMYMSAYSLTTSRCSIVESAGVSICLSG